MALLMSETASGYRVLARKYRPSTFAELIGQGAMVRTLSNAIQAGRIAHAFILTGVRGVGKTTTARIIARALNCVGPDGTGGPTAEPCGVCAECRAIAEDRHPDVIEMDAASRTGVDDIRDLIEGVRYRPVAARTKVYIIDEVHMLSRQAFSALLKTLEEPPPDVKFVFATTEVHKVPVTVLSRCQRFALRRVPLDLLVSHYGAIAAREGIAIEPAALALLARAADGSVRDGLSLLDQAIVLGGERVTEGAVREMLGIADRGQVFALFESVLRGETAAALARMESLYQGGDDPATVLRELLDLCHFTTRLKLAPEAGSGDPLAEGDRERAGPLAERLSLPVLARVWQMLLKGVEEVDRAPAPKQASDMVLVRLAHVADLPAPEELVRALEGGAPPAPSVSKTPVAAPTPAAPLARSGDGGTAAKTASALKRAEPAALPAAAPDTAAPSALVPQSFTEVVALCEERREAVLCAHLGAHVHLVRFEPGRIECRLAEDAPAGLVNRLGQLLGEWTGMRWLVVVSDAAGEPTLKEQEEERARALRNEVAAHPLVRAVLETFPGATIAAVRERCAAAEAGLDPGDETGAGEDES
ncbi:MAG: DNA polymerase III subunit gamma/tau [Stellaceae bacterium]